MADTYTLQVGVKLLAQYQNGFLILKRSDSLYKGIDGTMWDIPGGRIDTSIDLYENLKRELLEETGLHLDDTTWEGLSLLGAQDIWMHEKQIHVIRLTFAGRLHGDIRLSPEHEEYKVVSYADLLTIFNENNLIGKVVREHKTPILSLVSSN